MPFGARVLSVVSVAFCLSGCGAPRTPVATRIVIDPGGVLLTEEDSSHLLSATVFDETGAVMEAVVTWSSSAEAEVSVSPDGLVEAKTPVGSAVITAKVGAAEGSVLVVAAQLVEGAVVVTDENIVGEPQPVDPAAEYGVGFRYSVTIADVPEPAIGAILLTNGSKQVVGRVIAVASGAVTLEVVPIDEVFSQLDIAASIDVSEAPFTTPQAVDDSFHIDQLPNGSIRLRQRPDVTLTSSTDLTPQAEFGAGAFQCKTELNAVQVSLAQATAILAPNLTYDIVWNDDQHKIVLGGSPKVTLDVSPILTTAIDGKMTCKLELREIHIPVPGPLGALIAAVVPIGAGFELSGKVPIQQVGAKLTGDMGATLQLGFDCDPDRVPVQSATSAVDGSATPILPASFTGVKVEASAYAFLFADLQVGARVSSLLRLEAIESAAGLKLEAKLASEETQAADDAYASEYEALFEASISAGSGFERFLDLVKVTVAKLELKVTESLAKSPRGTVAADIPSFSTGDTVNFTVTFDPTTLTFPVIGPNVAFVRVYRKTGDSLILANQVNASAGQTELVVPWVATVDGTVAGAFVAFVETRLLSSPRLELGPVTATEARTATFTYTETWEQHRDEFVPGSQTIESDEVGTYTATYQLDLISESSTHKLFEIVSGTATYLVEEDFMQETLNSGFGDSTYDELIEDHWTTQGTTSATGELTLGLSSGSDEYQIRDTSQVLDLALSGVWSVVYTFLGPESDCRSNSTEPWEDVNDTEMDVNVVGVLDPSSPDVFEGTEQKDGSEGTSTKTWRLEIH